MNRAAVFLVLAALGVALLLRLDSGPGPANTPHSPAPAWTGSRPEPPAPSPGPVTQEPGPLVEIPAVPGVGIRADGPFALVLFREDTDIPALRIEGAGAEPDETGEMFLVRDAQLTLFGPDGLSVRASVDAATARVPAHTEADSVVLLEGAVGHLAEDSAAGPLTVTSAMARASVDSFASDGEVTITSPGAVCRGTGVSWSAADGSLVVERRIRIETTEGAVVTSNGPLTAALDTSGGWRIEAAGGVTIDPGPDLPAGLSAERAFFTVRTSDQGPVLESGSLAGPVTFEGDSLSGTATGATIGADRQVVLHQPIRISLPDMAQGAEMTSATPMRLDHAEDHDELRAAIDGAVTIQDPTGAVLHAASFRTVMAGPDGGRSAVFGGPVRGSLPRADGSVISFRAEDDMVALDGASGLALGGSVQAVVRGGPRDGQVMEADRLDLGADGALAARGRVSLDDPASGLVLTGEEMNRGADGSTLVTGSPARLVDGRRSIEGERIEMAAGGASATISGAPLVLNTDQGPVQARQLVWTQETGSAVLTGGVETRSEVMGWIVDCRRLVVDQGSGLPLEADGIVVRVEGRP